VILSVVIPTCNKQDLLQRTLTALLAQDLPTTTWEIVVVDDGSVDETPHLLRRFEVKHGERLKVVATGHNIGRAAARNRGVREARGKWIVFLDDDILAPPDLLAAHWRRLAAHPGCGTIGLVRTAPEVIDAPHFHYIDTRGAAKIREGTVPARYFLTQNAALPRQAFLEAGGFDERFVTYGLEDTELGFRLEKQLGLPFYAVTEPVPLHLHHHTLDQYLDKKRLVGRSSLPVLVELHPDRIVEMKLHWIVDRDFNRGPTFAIRIFRRLAQSRLLDMAQSVIGKWPVKRDHGPLWRQIYCRAMDGLVLAHYYRGRTMIEDDKANMA
jgi:glycosyltransferase involved in cell wall biosynthesis